MPGIKNMTVGAAFCVGGLVLSIGTVAVSNGSFIVAFWGAVLFGGLQFIWGALQWLFYQTKSPEKKAEHHLKIDIRILLRSMIAVAAADHELDESEVVMIQFISKAVLGDEIDAEAISNIFSKMKSENYLEELNEMAREASVEGAELAIKSAVMVSLSDGNMDEKEQQLIAAIASSLKVQGDRLKACVSDARVMYAELIAEQQTEILRNE